ncbi:MAG: hypothetical protein JWQ03_435 [Variovorax sp.]|nr:hypothetical protein [Variovorax sp.]
MVSTLIGVPRPGLNWPFRMRCRPSRARNLEYGAFGLSGETDSGSHSAARKICTRASSTSLKKATTASCSIRRWRFFVNTVGTQTASSIARPMNQRNSMLYCVCSMSWRSERMLNRISSSIARSSFSGAMLGRPPFTSASYIRENNPSILDSASLTITRMRRNG